MSCHYAVRFAPDSLRDFHDEIKIQTQSTVPITVPLLGRRPPPKLTCKKMYNKFGTCGLVSVALLVKETRSATMNIFKKNSFLFKSLVKAELS